MSKPVKTLIRKELTRRLEGVTSLAVINLTGVDSIATSTLRAKLRAKDIRVLVVKNSLAKAAFKEMGLESAADLLEGPSAIAYGSDNVVTVVRELLGIKKDVPNLTVKAAVLDGEPFGAERIEELSKYPTRTEAIARVVGCVLSPAGRLVGAILGPGGKIAGVLKALEEKQEGSGESAAAESAGAAEPAAE